MNKWPGHDEMIEVLQALNSAANGQGSVTNAVTAVVNSCIRHQKEYKMVVHEVECFIIESTELGRLHAIHAMDMLCRKAASGKFKENFSARFATRMKSIFSHLEGISEANRLIVAKIVYQWRKRQVFPLDCLPKFEDLREQIEGGGSSKAKDSADAQDVVVDGVKTSLKASTASGKGKIAVKKGTKRMIIRFCPFPPPNTPKTGCPFGEKCRFSHVDPEAEGQYMITRGATKKQPSTQVIDARDALDFERIEAIDLPSTKDVTNVGMMISTAAFLPKKIAEKEEHMYFKRHKLSHAYSTQEDVTFSWVNDESLGNLL